MKKLIILFYTIYTESIEDYPEIHEAILQNGHANNVFFFNKDNYKYKVSQFSSNIFLEKRKNWIFNWSFHPMHPLLIKKSGVTYNTILTLYDIIDLPILIFFIINLIKININFEGILVKIVSILLCLIIPTISAFKILLINMIFYKYNYYRPVTNINSLYKSFNYSPIILSLEINLLFYKLFFFICLHIYFSFSTLLFEELEITEKNFLEK